VFIGADRSQTVGEVGAFSPSVEKLACHVSSVIVVAPNPRDALSSTANGEDRSSFPELPRKLDNCSRAAIGCLPEDVFGNAARVTADLQ
jgi:hypothetical protein